MKKNILSAAFAAITAFTLNAQNVNIPDANFKSYLVGNTAINTNSDTEIQVSEASAFNGSINIGGLGNVSDLTGIEEFTALTQLICWGNPLTDVDLSNNSALTLVNFEAFLGDSLDFSANTLLTAVYVGYSDSLASLNIANGNNTNFTNLSTTSTPRLTCIQVDNASYSTANWTSGGFLYANGGDSQFSEDCSAVSSIADFYTTNNTINIYPNPTSGAVSFLVPINLKLTNATGQIVANKINVNTLDLSDLPTGIYFITLTDNKGQLVQQNKIVKE